MSADSIPTESPSSPYIELIQQLNGWSQTIMLTVDNRNRLEWEELSPLGIAVHKAAEALRTLTTAATAVIDAESEWDVHETIDGLREALGLERLDRPGPNPEEDDHYLDELGQSQ